MAKDDLLADRLRLLRDRADRADKAPPKRPTDGPPSPGNAPALPRPDATDPEAPPRSGRTPHHADYDGLLETDDGFLEDLLRGEDTETVPDLPLDARADLDALRELARQFAELGKAQDAEGKDDDDSDGEGMRRDAEDIVSEALAAARSDPEETAPVPVAMDGSGDPRTETDTPRNPAEEANPALTLPSVPTDLPSPTTPLPQNPPSTGDFEDDMARRMAALKNFKPAQAASDSLDLPSVPTFHPSDKVAAEKAKSAGRVGFTDDDTKTWCVVCLEDGTLICPGCDEDVYCSRCWHEMHRGPSAGYDETLHEALHFNKDQKKKKLAVGA